MPCDENHAFDVMSTTERKVACIKESFPGMKINDPDGYLPQLDSLVAEIAEKEFLKIMATAAKLARMEGMNSIGFDDIQDAVRLYIRENGLKTSWKLKASKRKA